ncbi:arginase family protein [uncultured Nisaea sp.]|jgi:agmatinase|uniref:arginase family protein n=1 Tax=uncultured Nisaea sp. TaxID=538215 RepID=UPI0030EE5281|tara:strand:+ start:3083 stop:4048 length:966 start_codon:yes stop_codon:yes gene_type:complete
MTGKPDLGALFGATPSSTFLGVEKCDDLDGIQASSVFIGAPGATPYGSVGAYCRNAPDALRKATSSLTSNIDRHNFDLGGPVFPAGTRRAVDCGDLPFDEKDFGKNRAVIKNAIGTITGKGAVPILVGGDDSVPIPMLEALSSTGQTFTILQIDAHIDWRRSHMDEELGLSSTMRRASEMPHIERIVQVGARGTGSAHSDDHADAVAWGAEFFTAHDIHRSGVGPALARIPDGANIIVCIDVDALDPSIVPGVIGRTPGGLAYHHVLDLMTGAARTGRIAAMDFVEYVPEADIDGLGGLATAGLISAAMGILARQDAGLPI